MEEIEELGGIATKEDANHSIEQSQIVEQLHALIQRLNPIDRQVILPSLRDREESLACRSD